LGRKQVSLTPTLAEIRLRFVQPTSLDGWARWRRSHEAVAITGAKSMRFGLACIAAAASLILTSGLAQADTFQTYDLAWSGAGLGNGASAMGTMTVDLTTLINPTVLPGLGDSGYYDIVGDITSLNITVSGATSGNGAYTLTDLCACSDYGSFTYWYTNGITVNMSGNVLAQLQADGGDFNLFFSSPGPQGTDVLTMTTDAQDGDPMTMTEFAPVSAPEPSVWAMLGVGVFGLGFALRRAKSAAA
jgi:hypothetical protein